MEVEYTTGLNNGKQPYRDFFDEYLELYQDSFVRSMKDRAVKKKDFTPKMIVAVDRIMEAWLGPDVEQTRKDTIAVLLGNVDKRTLQVREREFIDSMTGWIKTARATPRQVSYLLRIVDSAKDPSMGIREAAANLQYIEEKGTPLVHPNCLCDTDVGNTESASNVGGEEANTHTRVEDENTIEKELAEFDEELNQDVSIENAKRQKARNILGNDFYK